MTFPGEGQLIIQRPGAVLLPWNRPSSARDRRTSAWLYIGSKNYGCSLTTGRTAERVLQLEAELEDWKSQTVISNKEGMGLRKPPLAFAERGVAQLSSVLNGETAVEVNIRIIRIFTRMWELLLTHKDILIKLKHMEKKVIKQGGKQGLIQWVRFPSGMGNGRKQLGRQRVG